jgi:hypothetical protein
MQSPVHPKRTSGFKVLAVVFGMILGGYALAGVITLITGKAPKNAPALSQPVATPASSGVTMVNYARLQTGMTYAQACNILGQNGVESARSEMAGIETVLYQWQGEGIANMNAMFQNGKLVQKAQFGLK